MNWHDDYTNTEIEMILTNMLNWIGEHKDEEYNMGSIKDLNELVEFYVNMGFHEDEVRSWYDWLND